MSFPSKRDEERYFNAAEVIAYEEIYGHKYWAETHQYYPFKISFYVIDPKGAEKLQKREDIGAKVVNIFFSICRDTSYKRIIDRKTEETDENRLIADDDMFSLVKCDYVVDSDTNSVLETKELVKEIVKREVDEQYV